MAHSDTFIAGIGVEYFRCLTQTHTAEDLLGDDFPVPFKREPMMVRIIDWDGVEHRYTLIIPETPRQLDNTRLRRLLEPAELREWRFRGTPLFVTSAKTVTKRLIAAARRGVTVYGSANAAVRR
jgi:hypothetical protein